MQRAGRRPWLGRNYAGSSSSLFPVSRVNSLTCRVSLGWWEHVRVPAPCLGPCGPVSVLIRCSSASSPTPGTCLFAQCLSCVCKGDVLVDGTPALRPQGPHFLIYKRGQDWCSPHTAAGRIGVSMCYKREARVVPTSSLTRPSGP